MSQVKKNHAHMIDDPRRTEPLLRAIRKTVHKGDVVVDIGTGLGLLAIEAAKAGAKKVCAIDVEAEAISIAQDKSVEEGVSHLIEFIVGLSFDLELTERADVIICETVGSFAFDENILATLKDAKNRLLKDGGAIIPGRLELWGAPLDNLPKIEEPADIALVKGAGLVGQPVKITSVDLSKQFEESLRTIAEFTCTKSAAVEAISVWPKVFWGKGETTDASPLLPPTHWKQGILPIEPRTVEKGSSARIEIIIEPHPDDPLTMTERLWRWVE